MLVCNNVRWQSGTSYLSANCRFGTWVVVPGGPRNILVVLIVELDIYRYL